MSHTRDQRLQALARANSVRSHRALLKRELKQRRQGMLDILLEPPDWARTMKIAELLLAAPRVGPVKTRKVLTECRISPSKTLGGLTERQRDELASIVRRSR